MYIILAKTERVTSTSGHHGSSTFAEIRPRETVIARWIAEVDGLGEQASWTVDPATVFATLPLTDPANAPHRHPLHAIVGPVPIPHTRRAVAHLLRTRSDLEPAAGPGRHPRPRRCRTPHPRLHLDHRVISPNRRTALLHLRNL